MSLRDDPSVVAFERSARAFVSLVKTPPSEPGLFAERLFRCATQVSTHYWALRVVEPANLRDDVNIIAEYAVTDEEWKEVFDAASALPVDPFHEYRWPDGEVTLADVRDDVADIYRDLAPGLRAWDEGDDALPPKIVWDWRSSHDHWSRHLSGLRRALRSAVERDGWRGVPLVAGEREFLSALFEKHPDWESHVSRLPSGLEDEWTAIVRVPSPTGDPSRAMVLCLDGEDPSVGLGDTWHTHAQDLDEFWDCVNAILSDQLVLAIDVGGEHDGYEGVLDLREEDALLEHLTSPYCGPQVRIASFTGSADRLLEP